MPHDAGATPFELLYKPDAPEAQDRLRAYWAGAIVDRACASVRAPKTGAVPPPRSLITCGDFDLPRAIADFEAWAGAMFFGGESMPALMPNWGPDQWAGFLGAELHLVPEMDTSWAAPLPGGWNDLGNLQIDPQNRWWQGLVELTRLAGEACPGRFIVSQPDAHSNLDCLAALRGPQQLCIDLVDQPERVLAARDRVDALYRPVYDTFFKLGRMDRHGTTSWLDMWSPRRTQAVQCDFCYMISPEHFRRFVLPALERETASLDHAVYHLDGVGQLRHLDDLLALAGLHTIQWVPGAGQPSAPAWIELFRKIQRAGKGVQVLVAIDEAKALYRQLPPEQTFYWVLDCPSQSAASELLDWMRRHT